MSPLTPLFYGFITEYRYRMIWRCIYIYRYITAMVALEYDAFLSELTRLFQRTRTSGKVLLTMKRYDGRTKPKPRESQKGGESALQAVTTTTSTDYHCLIRAKSGNTKISTVVHAKDVNKFHMAYANVLKANMDSLKKHTNKKGSTKGTTKKTKATQ